MLYGAAEAVQELLPDLIWLSPYNSTDDVGTDGHAHLHPPMDGKTYDDIWWYNMPDEMEIPSREVVDAKVQELNDAEAMRLLRIERDRRIAETDWWASSDLTMSSERTEYRQALRDLPSVATPSLDEEGELLLTSVTWPTKPL